MARLLFVAVVVGLVAVWTVPALADLAIVQSWPVDTFPGGICYDSDRDHIWLVNDSTNEVREYSRIGALLGMFPGSQVGLVLPIGMDFDAGTTHLWIADETTAEKVVECTREGVFVSEFSVDAAMQDASGVALDTNTGNLFVADDNAHEVVEWTQAGVEVGRWSTMPCSDADAICFLSTDGTLLLGDDTAGMVYEFDTSGGLIATYNMGALLGITGVEGLAYDANTYNVFLADSDSYNVYEISGFVEIVPVEEIGWGAIKAMFR
jgi:DNA-binding beta-propeller fold protein YncE